MVATLTTVSATFSSSREEINQFITSVNSFHPALKYTWKISETLLAFNIKVSISSNGLCTNVLMGGTNSSNLVEEVT